MFTVLGRIPSFDNAADGLPSVSCADLNKIKKGNEEKYDYKLARVAMEGWFPPSLWMELNHQTWAGLGQLLNDEASRHLLCEFLDKETMNHYSPWRHSDSTNFKKILHRYIWV
jgi:hypothetical protein